MHANPSKDVLSTRSVNFQKNGQAAERRCQVERIQKIAQCECRLGNNWHHNHGRERIFYFLQNGHESMTKTMCRTKSAINRDHIHLGKNSPLLKDCRIEKRFKRTEMLFTISVCLHIRSLRLPLRPFPLRGRGGPPVCR